MQIRTRLTLLFLLIAAGILAGVLFAVYFLFKKNTEETFFNGLESKAEMTTQTALRDPALLKPLQPIWIPPEDDTLPYRDNISIFDDSYERIFAVHADAPPVSVKDLQEIYSHRTTRFKHYNLHALGRVVNHNEGRPYVVVVEGFCDPTELTQLRNILIISFIVGMASMAASGWYYAGQALAPVSRIINEVDTIQPSDLSHRVVTGISRDELTRLAETFNRLLDRVEQAFRMQRMFLSNVSHELKTRSWRYGLNSMLRFSANATPRLTGQPCKVCSTTCTPSATWKKNCCCSRGFTTTPPPYLFPPSGSTN
ncbi:MAG: HAMP domain-containing protein [Lewinellaceae bacterium]|nr:HAMP domain-containing protein [Lewinellaceae bacterium]